MHFTDVIGANDGIVSVGSILMGIGQSSQHNVVLAGVSALVGGAFSMALGELVSVYSQKDTEPTLHVRLQSRTRDRKLGRMSSGSFKKYISVVVSKKTTLPCDATWPWWFR